MRVVFLGSQEIGARCLEVVLAGGHDVVGVGAFEPGPHEQWTDDVTRILQERDLPRIRGRRFRTPKALDELRALRPDILFAIGWRWILPAEVLAIPSKGCLGIHGTLLPKGRGFAPVNWPLIRDEPRTGPTLFYFDDGTDTGDVVGQMPFDLTDDDDAAAVRRRLADASVALLERELPGLVAGTAPRIAQSSEGATYGPRRRPEDGGIDWHATARETFNWVRGLTRPYPGAFTYLGERKVSIWKVRVAPGLGPGPGFVVREDLERLVVGSGPGMVEILDASFGGDENSDAFARVAAEARLIGRFRTGAPAERGLA
jgi:methionyl-tRNA formyltransferase